MPTIKFDTLKTDWEEKNKNHIEEMEEEKAKLCSAILVAKTK